MSGTTTAHDGDDDWWNWQPFGPDGPYWDPGSVPPTGWDTGGPGFDGGDSLRPPPTWSTTNNGACVGLFAMTLAITLQELPTEYFYEAVVTQTTVTTCFTKKVKCKHGQSLVHTMNGDPRSPLGKRANRSGNFILIANGRPYGPKKIWLPWPQLLGPDGEYGGWPSMTGSNGAYQGKFNYTFFLGCCKSSGCGDKTEAKSFNLNGTISKSTIGNSIDPVFPPFNDPRERAADIAYVRLLQEFGPTGKTAKPKFPRCCSSTGTTFGGSRG